MPTIPTTEPDVLAAGETWQWTKTFSDYTSPEFTLTYYFTQAAASPATFTIVATDVSGTFTIDVDEAVTAVYTPAVYYYQGYVTDGTDKFLAVEGQMEVLENFDGTSADPRSWACRVYEALQVSIEGSASATQLSYVIDGIQVSDMSGAQKITWIEYYRKICLEEEAKTRVENGKRNNSSGYFRFGSVR